MHHPRCELLGNQQSRVENYRWSIAPLKIENWAGIKIADWVRIAYWRLPIESRVLKIADWETLNIENCWQRIAYWKLPIGSRVLTIADWESLNIENCWQRIAYWKLPIESRVLTIADWCRGLRITNCKTKANRDRTGYTNRVVMYWNFPSRVAYTLKTDDWESHIDNRVIKIV